MDLSQVTIKAAKVQITAIRKRHNQVTITFSNNRNYVEGLQF